MMAAVRKEGWFELGSSIFKNGAKFLRERNEALTSTFSLHQFPRIQ